jgi:hypothetical protein
MAKMRSLENLCRAALLIVCLSLSACCTADPAPKKTVDDPLSKQARQMRATSSDEAGTGLSDRSREIEKDLGLR